MSKLTLLLPINARISKCVSVSQIIRSEINQKSIDNNVSWDDSVVNRPTPLPLNDDTSASRRNGVSVSELEVSSVLGMLGEGRA